jgi:vacuolar iron transporter family protein
VVLVSKNQGHTDMTDGPLEHEHTAEAIAKRLKTTTDHGVLGDFVLGAVDGAITTFAIVSGVAGAGLSAGIALVLGLANVLADGFSMAVGNYLKARSDAQVVDRYRAIEEKHIIREPKGEAEEVRQIFAAKGFKGETLEEVVQVITADRQRWVDTMLTEEWGLQINPPPPKRVGTVTFFAFVIAGLVPLLPLPFSTALGPTYTFLLSAAGTLVTFGIIGAVRGKVTNQSRIVGSAETVAIGGAAAALAFIVGSLLRGYTGV